MKSHWITHEGKRIFLADYTKLNSDEFAGEIKDATAEVRRQPHGSVRLLIDVHNFVVSPRELDLFKTSAKEVEAHVSKTAVLGVTGVRKALVDIVVKFSGMAVNTFDGAEKAKVWLAQ